MYPNPVIYQIGDIEEKITALITRMWDVKRLAGEPMGAIIEDWRTALCVIHQLAQEAKVSLIDTSG